MALVSRYAMFLFAVLVPGFAPAWANPKLTVVELYTSQGCPSCPPADAYLLELAERKDILALSFHVDYWDFIGWKDVFAAPAYTRRQQVYADRLGVPYLFTPQMVIDGVWQGSGADRAAVANQISAAGQADELRAKVDLTLESEDQIRVRISPSFYAVAADVLLLRYDTEAVVDVTRGENSGRRLRSGNIVRDLHPLAVWRGEALDLSFPLEDLGDVGKDFGAIIVQESGQGKIIGAASLDLRGPRAR